MRGPRRPLPGLVTPLLLFVAACPGSAGAAPEIPGPPRVRVRLVAASARTSVRITAAGAFELTNAADGESLETGEGLSRDVALRGGALKGTLRLRAANGLTVDGRGYPGDLLLVPDDGGVVLVNETDLESYLPGVLAGELGSAYPAAALRAQAIAARTYALSRIRRDPDAAWHLADDTSSQAYRGRVGPDDGPLRSAVSDTTGLVLRWDGKLLPTWYHSACGGLTAAARDVFGEADVPPFTGVPCPFCVDSPRFRYRVRIPRDDVQTALGLGAPPTAVAVEGRTEDGRARAFRFAPGDRTIPAVEVRARIGPERLPSTLVESVEADGRDLVFTGRGFGHGVGLCQWGAVGMARRGAGPADILAQYYPGAEICRLY